MEVYYREKKEVIEEPEAKLLRFLYKTIIGRMILKILVQPYFSKLISKFMKSSMSKFLIKKYNSESSNLYNSFNSYFTRKYELNMEYNNEELISPAESKLSVYQITNNMIINIKNTKYTLEEILQDKSLAQKFKDGLCLVFRLSPENYHRYIFIDDVEKQKSRAINGILHTVKPIKDAKCKVYKQNTREYTYYKTKNIGNIIQMEVGALLIGKIKNYDLDFGKKGEEKGYFEYGGSTIILLIEKDKITIDKDILEMSKNNIETMVKIGEKIGKITKKEWEEWKKKN